jgi:acetoin utilization protein AcuB
MRMFELMTPTVHTVSPSCGAEDAWQMMHTRNVRHLIVTEGSHVVGMLSDADLGGRSGAMVRAGATAGELMDRHIVSVTRHDTVRKVANLMRGRLVDCLPVVEDGRLVGVITASDLLMVLGRGVDRPGQPTRTALHHKVPHRRAKAATGQW